MKLISPVFTHQKKIPEKYTCDSEDISPALKWESALLETEAFALIMDDPDASVGTWIHWVIYNIPAEINALGEAVPRSKELPNGIKQGKNSWGRIGYGGPCPSSGTHRYVFKLYALDSILDLPSGLSEKSLLQALDGHILASAELIGLYKRKIT
jgi:Raf kinase inhibitor-like YbhB/YbcL family protein